jgi:hypothetical protein
MRKIVHTTAAAVVLALSAAGCRTMTAAGDPDDSGALGAAHGNTVKTAVMVAGGIMAAAGPAVIIAGIALDKQPATPPVEAFVAGAGLTTAGVTTILIANAAL